MVFRGLSSLFPSRSFSEKARQGGVRGGEQYALGWMFSGRAFYDWRALRGFYGSAQPILGEYGACGKGGISTMKTLLQVLVRRGSVELGAGWG